MFIPLECFQGQCAAICQLKYPDYLKKCIENDTTCSKESVYHPSLIQELLMKFNYITGMYEYRKRLIDDNYNREYYSEQAKLSDPSNKEEKPEYTEGMDLMGELKKIGRLRNISEICHDFDKSTILKYTLE